MTIQISKKSKGVANWFSDEWVTNGHFAVKRDNVMNPDEHLMALGFEYRDGDELDGRLRFIPESFDSVPIFDSGFKFQGLTLFFGKNHELVCFETQYMNELNIVRAEYSEATQSAKVYEGGAVSMILKPYMAGGTGLEKHFPDYRLLPQVKK